MQALSGLLGTFACSRGRKDHSCLLQTVFAYTTCRTFTALEECRHREQWPETMKFTRSRALQKVLILGLGCVDLLMRHYIWTKFGAGYPREQVWAVPTPQCKVSIVSAGNKFWGGARFARLFYYRVLGLAPAAHPRREHFVFFSSCSFFLSRENPQAIGFQR